MSEMLPRIAFIVGLVFSLLISERGTADPNTLRVSSFIIPPYIMGSEKGGYKGLFIDWLEVASQKTGIKIDYVISNWPRAQKQARDGTVDAIFPVVRTPERENWLLYPAKPLTQFSFMVFARKLADFNFNGDLNVLLGRTFGKIAKAKMHPAFSGMEKRGDIKVVERASLEMLVKALDGGRIDAFGAPKLMGEWAIEKSGSENIKYFETPFGVSNIYLALSRNSKKQEIWEKLLAAIDTGALEVTQ